MLYMIIWFLTYLDTYREIVFLNPFKVEWLIDFHVCIRPPIVLPLLEVERVVLVRLVRRTSDQLVEYGWVVLYTRAGWGNRLGVGPYWCLRRLHLIDWCPCKATQFALLAWKVKVIYEMDSYDMHFGILARRYGSLSVDFLWLLFK